MTVEELIIEGKKYVHSTHAKMILADILGVGTLELLTILDQKVDDNCVLLYQQKIQKLMENKPIQYVIGNVNFYGYSFLVDENVLIPRFETEELVENTLSYIEKLFDHRDLKVIDLGCGSGCIGITLKKKIPSLNVTLLDISPLALEVAKKNANNLGVSVSFIEGDMLENIHEKFDVIISNPPYLCDLEKIDPLVSQNEPPLALYGGEDGLDYYRKIFLKALSCVSASFLIALEIGEDQREAIVTLAKTTLPTATIEAKKDLQGRDRMIFIFQK